MTALGWSLTRPGLALLDELGRRVERERIAQRLEGRDHTLWSPDATEIADRLGWLDVARRTLEQLPDWERLRAQARAAGLTHAVVLGMGGSSLAPEVLRRSFHRGPEGLELAVLDSTHPRAIADLTESLPLERTLFVVSSKSGSTLEPNALLAHFESVAGDPSRFIAITDPGSSLESHARERGFRAVVHGEPEIGGRFSALSAFGMLPAILYGLDARRLLIGAADFDPAPIAWGLALGTFAAEGHDKLTLFVDPPIESLALWLEQLIAESTGKRGAGIIPVAGEPHDYPRAYGADRLVFHIRNATRPDGANRTTVAQIEGGEGRIGAEMTFSDPYDLGRLFYDWEIAIAAAGIALELNPFDQPDVQRTKDLTNATIAAFRERGELPPEEPEPVPADDAAEQLTALLEAAPENGYVALMAFLPESSELDAALAELRAAIRAGSGLATTSGYGPRFLHSTGQLHKGGPRTGVFVQFVDRTGPELPVPGAGYDFGTLVRAQALGDAGALRDLGAPLLRIELGDRPAEDLAALARQV